MDRRARRSCISTTATSATFHADPETFHLTVMLGAGGIKGGIAGICRTLKGWTQARAVTCSSARATGSRTPPRPSYLAMLGGDANQYLRPRAATSQAGIEAGLVPLHA